MDHISTNFADLDLPSGVLTALAELGYETPSPIQRRVIPELLSGRDVLGQAQTGTGKTAAFALPSLTRLDLSNVSPQVLVLAPTRELAIQVAEAFQRYARHLPGVRATAIYGGQSYTTQLRQLKRGVHVIVGTPGRVIDHMRRGTLKVDSLRTVVLDEADEMLRMGFVEDVEWILQQVPRPRQIALFSATMPKAIIRIAQTHLCEPKEVRIEQKTATADTVRQRFWPVRGINKLDALTRLLEVEDYDAILCFVRTKTASVELAEKLNARGLAATALNGDIAQKQREQTIERLKSGQLDILVATDVAARGIDVERISHVINYDIPSDPEAYVHRIGRTGRAGRRGETILFVAPRERRMLESIRRATRSSIEEMRLPSNADIAAKKISEFKHKLSEHRGASDAEFFESLAAELEIEFELSPRELAATLIRMQQGHISFIPKAEPVLEEFETARPKRDKKWTSRKGDSDASPRSKRRSQEPHSFKPYRIRVGREHGIGPGDIVGAIANEANLSSASIGAIVISRDSSTVELPAKLPQAVFEQLRKIRVAGQQLDIRPERGAASPKGERPQAKATREKHSKRPRTSGGKKRAKR